MTRTSFTPSAFACGLTAHMCTCLRAVVGFGPDLRSRGVRERFETVLEVVNRYLPSGMLPIEVWAMVDGRPARV